MPFTTKTQISMLLILVQASMAYKGAIMQASTGKYLTCTTSKCTFEASATQLFVQNGGSFHITMLDGTSLDTCLDRQHCHSDTSNSRSNSCSACGAIHWSYDAGRGRLTEDSNKNCIQDDGSIRHCGDGHAVVKFVDPSPANCTATAVSGSWVYRYTIAAASTETWKTGTEKSHSQSKTESWSNSVTISVAAGWSFMGGGAAVEVDTTIAHRTSSSYTDEWSESTEHDFSVTFGSSDVGKAAWQFQFTPIVDSCGHKETTLVKEFALTKYAAQEPCCIPGYSTDAPAYTTCVSAEAMIKNGAALGCKIMAANATHPHHHNS